jgi:hypothetical protein
MKQLLLVLFTALLLGGKAFGQSKTSSAEAILFSDTAKKVLQWKQQNIDMGTIPDNEVKSVIFEFTNTGKVPITITKINTFCGCTVADYPKTPTPPGKSAQIKVSYTPGAFGYFSKTISVATDINELGILLIHGVVVKGNYGQ